MTAQQQRNDTLQLLSSFAEAVAHLSAGRGWNDFELLLEKGEQMGKWSYITQASPPTKRLHNTCPCAKSRKEEATVSVDEDSYRPNNAVQQVQEVAQK